MVWPSERGVTTLPCLEFPMSYSYQPRCTTWDYTTFGLQSVQYYENRVEQTSLSSGFRYFSSCVRAVPENGYQMAVNTGLYWRICKPKWTCSFTPCLWVDIYDEMNGIMIIYKLGLAPPPRSNSGFFSFLSIAPVFAMRLINCTICRSLSSLYRSPVRVDGKGYVKVIDLQTFKKTCTFLLHNSAIYPSCHQEGLQELQTQAMWTVLFGKSVWEGVLLLFAVLFFFGLVGGSKFYLVGCNIEGVWVAQMELLPVKSYPLLATRIRTMNRIHLHIPLDFI